MTRLLYVGDTWQGSSARSLREALVPLPDVVINDVGSDQFVPNYHQLPMRIASRILRPFQRRELERAIFSAIQGTSPEAVVVYKGVGVDSGTLTRIQKTGLPVVNVYPDYSPHSYGPGLQKAIGLYDLVISTKPFHPKLWQSVYGYRNACVCVPHGYDPGVHYWADPAPAQTFDVVLCATWRPEYHRLMRGFAEAMGNQALTVAIGGAGWAPHRDELPAHWQLVGPRIGKAYGELIRSARIAIAPVNREVVVRGVKQPGDEDTTRTYELASAFCFQLHQRTDFVAAIFDEKTEVPLWSDPAELAALVRRWLPDEAGRRAMAAKAHARAVPAYSIPQRAASVLEHVRQLIGTRRG
jgi:spore maturation protein CgeB